MLSITDLWKILAILGTLACLPEAGTSPAFDGAAMIQHLKTTNSMFNSASSPDQLMSRMDNGTSESKAEDRIFFPPYKFPYWGLPYGMYSQGGFFNPGLFPFVPGGPGFPPMDGIFGSPFGPGDFPGGGPTPFRGPGNGTMMGSGSSRQATEKRSKKRYRRRKCKKSSCSKTKSNSETQGRTPPPSANSYQPPPRNMYPPGNNRYPPPSTNRYPPPPPYSGQRPRQPSYSRPPSYQNQPRYPPYRRRPATAQRTTTAAPQYVQPAAPYPPITIQNFYTHSAPQPQSAVTSFHQQEYLEPVPPQIVYSQYPLPEYPIAPHHEDETPYSSSQPDETEEEYESEEDNDEYATSTEQPYSTTTTPVPYTEPSTTTTPKPEYYSSTVPSTSYYKTQGPTPSPAYTTPKPSYPPQQPSSYQAPNPPRPAPAINYMITQPPQKYNQNYNPQPQSHYENGNFVNPAPTTPSPPSYNALTTTPRYPPTQQYSPVVPQPNYGNPSKPASYSPPPPPPQPNQSLHTTQRTTSAPPIQQYNQAQPQKYNQAQPQQYNQAQPQEYSNAPASYSQTPPPPSYRIESTRTTAPSIPQSPYQYSSVQPTSTQRLQTYNGVAHAPDNAYERHNQPKPQQQYQQYQGTLRPPIPSSTQASYSYSYPTVTSTTITSPPQRYKSNNHPRTQYQIFNQQQSQYSNPMNSETSYSRTTPKKPYTITTTTTPQTTTASYSPVISSRNPMSQMYSGSSGAQYSSQNYEYVQQFPQDYNSKDNNEATFQSSTAFDYNAPTPGNNNIQYFQNTPADYNFQYQNQNYNANPDQWSPAASNLYPSEIKGPWSSIQSTKPSNNVKNQWSANGNTENTPEGNMLLPKNIHYNKPEELSSHVSAFLSDYYLKTLQNHYKNDRGQSYSYKTPVSQMKPEVDVSTSTTTLATNEAPTTTPYTNEQKFPVNPYSIDNQQENSSIPESFRTNEPYNNTTNTEAVSRPVYPHTRPRQQQNGLQLPTLKSNPIRRRRIRKKTTTTTTVQPPVEMATQQTPLPVTTGEQSKTVMPQPAVTIRPFSNTTVTSSVPTPQVMVTTAPITTDTSSVLNSQVMVATAPFNITTVVAQPVASNGQGSRLIRYFNIKTGQYELSFN